MESYTTPKGTTLPIRDIHGANYLEVKYRIIWFREEKPEWAIETFFVSLEKDSAICRATIRDEKDRVRAIAHKSENKTSFQDFVEKAETGAIGRALALIGYGTQFAGRDLNEGERLADAPTGRPGTLLPAIKAVQDVLGAEVVDNGLDAELKYYVIPLGTKYKGKRLCDVTDKELRNYMDYFYRSAKEQGKPPSGLAQQFLERAELYLASKAERTPGESFDPATSIPF